MYKDRTIGFEDIFDHVTRAMGMNDWVTPDFPKYNIKKTSASEYVITLEIPGFKKEEVTLTVDDGILKIEGKKAVDTSKVLHKGIDDKVKFIRTFALAETAEVEGASMEDGLLHVTVSLKVPEPPAKPPAKLIAIK